MRWFNKLKIRLNTFKEKVYTKDVKKLIENFLSLSVLKFVNLILQLITLPYLIEVLGFEKYGVIIVSLSLMQYFQTITDYGFNYSATRSVATHKHSSIQLNFIYSKIVSAKVILLLISLFFLLPIILFIPQFSEHKLLYLCMLLLLVGYTFFPVWFFRGIEEMRYITLFDLVIKLIFALGVFLFIQKPDDYWVYALLNGSGYCCVAVFSCFLITKKYSVKFSFVRSKDILSTLKNGFPLFVNQLVPNFYNNTSNFLVGILLGNNSAGVFGAVRQVVNLLSVFNSVISMVFFPYLNRYKEQFEMFSICYLIIWIGVSLSFLIFHDFIFLFFGISGASSSTVLTFLVLGMFFMAVNSVFATNYLLVHRYDQLVMGITLKGSFIGFLLSYPTILYFGVVGASVTIAITQFTLGSLAFISYLKVKNMK